MSDSPWSRLHLCLQTKADDKISPFSLTKDPPDVLTLLNVYVFNDSSLHSLIHQTGASHKWATICTMRKVIQAANEQNKDWVSTVRDLGKADKILL